jgi:hypothetical protein
MSQIVMLDGKNLYKYVIEKEIEEVVLSQFNIY